MCKDKWNGFNYDYNKVVDYHARIGHHIPFLDFTIEERDHRHLPRKFNWESKDVIQAFQGERFDALPSSFIDSKVSLK
jgi:hypothetical protein